MSDKNKKVSSQTPEVSGKKFRNPINKIGGKIMLWVLCGSMVIGALASLGYIIYLLITQV